MPAVGARALFSATRTRSLPRVARDSSTHLRRLDARAFRTSSQKRTRSEDAGAADEDGGLPEKPPPADGNPAAKADDGQPPTEPPPAPPPDTYKESLRSQGYGSARVRALRGRTVEEAPPFRIPAWFLKKHVSLLNARRITGAESAAHLVTEAAKAMVLDEPTVEAALKNLDPERVEELLGRLGQAQAPFRSPLSRRPDGPERSACLDLLAAARTELAASVPRSMASKRPSRPVTVLSVLNYKGRNVAASVVDDVATELGADVVHLDASAIARIVGGYLGQTQYWSRGATSMLGYAAAELNGRLLSRADAGSDSDDVGGLFISVPSRIRSIVSRKDPFLFGGGSDERWDDIKASRVLEELIEAADIKRHMRSPTSRRRDLILHVHDYLELGQLAEGIVGKLRSTVDRLWQSGRRAILIGSSSGDIHNAPQWRNLLQTSKEECHIIPLHVSDESLDRSAWESREATQENLDNISTMLHALAGGPAQIACDFSLPDDGMAVVHPHVDLGKGVYDVHWAFRVATLMLGAGKSRPKKFDLPLLRSALDTVDSRDKQWSGLYPVLPPYFSPVFSASASGDSFSMDPDDSGDMPGSGSGSGSASSRTYDTYEKKLLSGLINAKDIRTSFADIVAPESTKESLVALTSLSLVQPEAFSYGVLKTERIPGCLLYGPPGTGKTLLAKAVAKESGANMLEVSAASINDMYVGQSEKNVRALFSLARKLSPAVIFLDEADALLGSRHSGHGRTAHRETITQFLREWDGLTDMRAFIMVATNRPFDLDEAVLRRLPRRMLVDLPLRPEREAILRVILRDERLDEPAVDLARLAAETELYSGSDLKNLCVSAAMHAVRDDVRSTAAAAAAAAAAEQSSPPSSPPPADPRRRVLTRAHFDRALAEISASISDDMQSLKAIRRFDEQYGDAGRRRRRARAMGFEVVPGAPASEDARVRKALA